MQLSLFTVVPMILVLASASAESHLRGLQAKKCSGAGSTPEYGGDCSDTPTYCGRDGYGPRPPTEDPPSPFPQEPRPPAQEPQPPIDDFWNDSRASCNACGGFWPSTQPANCHDRYGKDLTRCGTGIRKLNGNDGIPPGDNAVSCRYQGSWHGEEDIPPNSDDARACFKPDKRCSREVENDFPHWCHSDYMGKFGGYRGGCSGTNNCLNLDFHCADGEYCEMSCTGTNSCNGLTMHCADNQFCELKCHASSRNPMCVGAKVICGEGTVAQGLACVPVDKPNHCQYSTTYAPTIAPTVSPTTAAPTTSPTSAPTTSPTEPIILTPTITYTCVGATCSDGSDGSTCGSDGGCCPFADTPSKGQCSCGTSWSDANVNKIPCEFTQQQPEPQPETASPTSNPTTNAPEPTFAPTPNPTPEPTFAPSSKPSGGPSNSPPSTNPSPVPTVAPITQPPTREDCPICTSSTVIEVSGNAFRSKVTQCIGGNCQDDVPIGCWDTSKVMDMKYAFFEKALFNDSINCWNTARVTDMSYMFYLATDFNRPLDDWNVASVTAMNGMFNAAAFNTKASNFNQSLNDWNVSNVQDMNEMFREATNFNQLLDDWNVASVTNMEYMFQGASNFNQPLGDWNVASVTNMAYMFHTAINFNQPLDDWNVESVTNMGDMFHYATNFNQSLNDWNVASVTDMSYMFRDASNFNQPLDDWNVASVTDMGAMFFKATYFNQCLSSWAGTVLSDIDVVNMFFLSGCPDKNPVVNGAPWCQGEGEQCSAPPTRG